MNIEPGVALGHYRILSLLGKGGMGEVYLAEDTELDRKIALKLLSAQSTSDPERVLRFIQEAKAASALNHPNIITIHEVGTAGNSRFLATEFIDGQTLRQLMTSSGVSLREALEYAIQVAGALSAAHEAGIVHRDIKPENIMIRRDGYVKVVDFGLAKLTEPETGPASGETVVMGSVATTLGVVMGTAQYMSPEQARGLQVDARTDLFSFGIVLYEMVAGRPPFAGETPSHQIVAILEKDPPPLAQLAPNTPPELERIITKTLAKPKEERYQSAKDLLVDLKQLKRRLEFDAELQHVTDSGRMVAVTPPHTESASRIADTTPVAASVSRRSGLSPRRKILITFAVIAGISAIAWAAYRWLYHDRIAFQLFSLTQLTDTGKVAQAIISPDGRYVVYTQSEGGQMSLNIRQVTAGTNVQIQPPITGTYTGLAFSRDGDFVYFTKRQPGSITAPLYRITSLGGEPKQILADCGSAISFSNDGSQFAYVRLNLKARELELFSRGIEGAGERRLKVVKLPVLITTDPAWSPDGKHVAIAVSTPSAGGYVPVIDLVSPGGGAERTIPLPGWAGVVSLAWLPDSHSLLAIGAQRGFVTSTQIWQVPLSGSPPRRVTNDLNLYSNLSLTGGGDTFVTVKHESITSLWVGDVADPAGFREITSPGPRMEGFSGIQWTPSGELLYAAKTEGALDLWIREAAPEGKARRLTKDLSFAIGPLMTRDGKGVLFSSNRESGAFHVWRYGVEDGSFTRLTSGNAEMLSSLSSDGQWALFSQVGKPGIWKISTNGGEPSLVTGKRYGGPSYSPDGTRIAFSFLDETAGNRQRFGLLASSGGEPIRVFDFANGAGSGIDWLPDGTALTYVSTAAGVSQIWSQPIDGSPPKQLTTFRSGIIYSYAWSTAGRLVLSRGNSITDAVLIRETK